MSLLLNSTNDGVGNVEGPKHTQLLRTLLLLAMNL